MESSKIVHVKPGNAGNLAEQGLAREQQESVFRWNMQVMFKAPYKSAELAVRAEHKLAGHFEGLRGQWAVCNSNGAAEVYVTRGAARANKQGAIVVRSIGALDTCLRLMLSCR